MKFPALFIAAAFAAIPAIAAADVRTSSADGFFLAFEGAVAAPPAKAYVDITQIQRWWDGEHTYSGKASNLTLKPEAGGCFCEKWKDGSVEHGRVVMALPGKVLRLETALGPLQERALDGILSFWIKSEDSATTLTVEYRVNGSSASGLAELAPSVDEVLGAQVARLRRYIATGSPEPSAEEKAAAAAAAKAAQDAAAEADISSRLEALKSEIEGDPTAAKPAAGAKPKPPKAKTPTIPQPQP